MKLRRLLIVLGVVIPLLTVASAAATAPTATQSGGTDYRLIVGVQGVGNQGAVVAYNADGSEAWRYEDAVSYHDVTVLDNGTVLAAYVEKAQSTAACRPYDPPCGRTGYRLIAPEPEPHVISEWSYPVRSIGNSEVHDVERVGPGQYLVADMDRERLLLVENQTITWSWSASSHYDPPEDPTREDWLHINDVDVLADGRYLVSVRNANQLVIVERGDGIVDVINQNGNTSLMRGQHNPQRLGPAAVLVADSGNDRIVELHRENGTWRPAWSLGSASGIAFEWPRDADRLPTGQTLITDSRNHRVILVDANGTVVASWNTPKLPYEADVIRYDEPTQGPPQHGGEDVPANGLHRYPVLGQVKAALQHSVGLPWYIGEQHIGVILAGLLAGFLGAVVELSYRLDELVNRILAEYQNG